jgi:hypothetical protein
VGKRDSSRDLPVAIREEITAGKMAAELASASAASGAGYTFTRSVTAARFTWHLCVGVIYVMHGLAVIAVLTGSLGRVIAVGVMLVSGLYLQINTGDLLSWGLLLTSLSLFFSGTGRFSLWKPEDWLIYHIAGEKSKS